MCISDCKTELGHGGTGLGVVQVMTICIEFQLCAMLAAHMVSLS